MRLINQIFPIPPKYRLGILLVLIILTGLQITVGRFETLFLGGDWSFPASLQQAKRFLEISTASWSNAFISFTGAHQINLFPAVWFQTLLIWFDLSSLLFLMMALVYFSFNSLAKALGIKYASAGLVAFIIYAFSATVFNYFIMGWVYLLIAMSLIPYITTAFIKALSGSRLYLVIAGFLLSLTAIQSQAPLFITIILFSLTTVSIFQENLFGQKIAILITVLLIFIVCNFYWLPSVLLYPPNYLIDSDIVQSQVSIGTSANLSLLNVLRNWGSLFNFQFESIVIKHGIVALSFMSALLAIIGLGFHKSRYRIAFGFLLIFPLLQILISDNRFVLEMIPFGNAFRDISRFIVIPLFGVTVLAMMGYEVIIDHCDSYKRLATVIICALLVAGAYPWWSGKMWDWEDTTGSDIRLRSKSYPISWFRVEKALEAELTDQKAFFYPLGNVLTFRDDPRFLKSFAEGGDVFANLSPIPGAISISDRKYGILDELVQELIKNEPSREQLNLLSELGVRYFIFRKNLVGLYPEPKRELIQEMVRSNSWKLFLNDDLIAVYTSNKFKPPVFINIGEECKASNPRVEYKRVSTTLYRIRLHNNSCNNLTLVLNETYNKYWSLAHGRSIGSDPVGSFRPSMSKWAGSFGAIEDNSYLIETLENRVTLPHGLKDVQFISKINQMTIQNENLPKPTFIDLLLSKPVDAKHSVGNLIMNEWSLNKTLSSDRKGIKTHDFYLEFKPQRAVIIGSLISLIFYIFLLIYMVINIYKFSFLKFENSFNKN